MNIKNKMIVSKELLEHLYCEKEYSMKKIAVMLDIQKRTVSNFLHRYDIPIIYVQRKSWHSRGLVMSDKQKQIIIGSSLGDGCLALHGRKIKKARFIESHCLKQSDYLKWKFQSLYPFCSNFSIINGKWQGCSITTCVHDEFTKLYNIFYHNGLKIVSDKLLEMLSPLSIAIWYMDDGSFNQTKHTVRIFTCAFSYEEHIKIQKYFYDKWNIVCSIHKCNKKNGKSYLYIHFSVTESKKFIELIRPYMHSSMLYKIGEHQILRDFMPNSKIKSELYGDIQNIAEMSMSVIEK